jgi:hypothetical protein
MPGSLREEEKEKPIVHKEITTYITKSSFFKNWQKTRHPVSLFADLSHTKPVEK